MKTKTLEQSVKFKKVKPDVLYDIYLNSKHHSSVIGAKVSISKKVGAKFSVFDGKIRGKNLHIVPKRMIVQSWGPWKKNEQDSILTFTFSKIPGGAQVDLVQVHVPTRVYKDIDEGWKMYYWRPLRQYLKRRK